MLFTFAIFLLRSTWPVLACIGIALGWTTYMGSRHLFTSPDVTILPAARTLPLKSEQEGFAQRSASWTEGHGKWIAKDHSKIRELLK